MYKLIIRPLETNIYRESDSAVIPQDLANSDYQQYLAQDGTLSYPHSKYR